MIKKGTFLHIHKIIASEISTRDSDVYNGGGTNLTDKPQRILDLAKNAFVHLVTDGAALIHGLCVHPNTIIEFISSSCGFFMEDHSNKFMFVNSA